MRYYYSYIFITIIYFFINFIVGLTDPLNNDTVFVPTKEWQTVKKGTPIPKGLHVRHNFQTGITEAKLMEENETENYDDSADNEIKKSLTLHPDAAKKLDVSEIDGIKFYQNDTNANISATELRAKLKSIKSMSKKKDNKFRTVNELKSNYENKKNGKSTNDEFDFLKMFIEQFEIHKDAIISGSLNFEEIKIIIDILSQLEYLVHDIDNGLEFAKSEGLIKVICPCLNGTIDEIKLEALRVLGATVQSNPKVKEAALELNLVQIILYTMRKSSTSNLFDRCLYALGSLIRNYPTAQKIFLNHGGLEIFSEQLEELESVSTSTQKRIINLINDLIIEREGLNEITDSEERELKIKQYTEVELEDKITNHILLCKNLANLLIKKTQHQITNNYNKVDNHDFLETIYQCVYTVAKICQHQFKQKQNEILPALNDISLFYANINNQNINTDYNENEHLLILVEKLKRIIIDNYHDEF